MNLRSAGARQKAYEAGNIVCRTYALGSLPSEEVMRADLVRFFCLYAESVAIKRGLLLEEPGSIASPSSQQTTGMVDPLLHFHPKSAEEYCATLVGRVLVKSRRHERLLADFATHCAQQGFSCSSEHPTDLLVRKPGKTFLVEAKVLYRGNATEAVRAAIGQLFTYAYLLFLSEAPQKVALFSEPVGEAYERLLASLQIQAIHYREGIWVGMEQGPTSI
jgi:hypothetical protein